MGRSHISNGLVSGEQVSTPTRIVPKAAEVQDTELLQSASRVQQPTDVGILDAIIEAEESARAGFASLERITTMTYENNKRLEEHANRITARVQVNASDPRVLKSAVDAAADDINGYARSLRKEIPVFTTSLVNAFQALDTATATWLKSENKDPKELATVEQQLREALPSLISAREPVIRFRDTMISVPPLTTRLTQAVSATTAQLDELIAGLAIISDKATYLLDRLEKSQSAADAGPKPRP
jgi:hypothetical protein